MVERFDGGKEGSFAGIIEAKEKNGILCRSVKNTDVILVSWVEASCTFLARSVQVNRFCKVIHGGVFTAGTAPMPACTMAAAARVKQVSASYVHYDGKGCVRAKASWLKLDIGSTAYVAGAATIKAIFAHRYSLPGADIR